MDATDSVSIIVPVYNEEKNLPSLIEAIDYALSELNRDTEIIAINDGSTDGSGDILDELSNKFPSLRTIHFTRNFGQTAALSAGFENSKGEVVIPMDADLQNDPRDIINLLNKMEEGFDVVSGWRKNRQDKWLTRRFPSIVANKFISWMSGIQLHDFGCTLKAYKKEFIQNIHLYGEMHRFVPVFASWQGAKVTEIPVNHHPRKFGHSKYGLARIVKVILDLIVIKFLVDFAVKPIYIFGGFGLLNFAGAFLAGCWAIYLKYWVGDSFIQTPLPLLVVMCTLIGFLSILIGLLAELMMRTYYESQQKPTFIIRKKNKR
jgi:glycosyltransferase involved in cell wall biosynthesis